MKNRLKICSLLMLWLLTGNWVNADNPINHTVRIGFIVDDSASIYDSRGRDRLSAALQATNQNTYNRIGIQLKTSFVRTKATNVQYTVKTTADVIAQATEDALNDLDILNDTQTDILMYIAPSLPNNTCGSAQIPTLREHFDSRTLIGVIEQGFCLNADVLGHEIGHLFGARHDRQNIQSRQSLSPTAIACLKGDVGGSIMSYASLRSQVFSSQSFCGASGYDNEGLVKQNASLVASLYERNADSQGVASAGSIGGAGGGGGSFSMIFFIMMLALTVKRTANRRVSQT